MEHLNPCERFSTAVFCHCLYTTKPMQAKILRSTNGPRSRTDVPLRCDLRAVDAQARHDQDEHQRKVVESYATALQLEYNSVLIDELGEIHAERPRNLLNRGSPLKGHRDEEHRLSGGRQSARRRW